MADRLAALPRFRVVCADGRKHYDEEVICRAVVAGDRNTTRGDHCGPHHIERTDDDGQTWKAD